MEYLQIEGRIGEWGGDGDEKSLVPDGFCGPGIVGFGGELVIRVDPEDGVRFEVAVLPIDVLQMLAGDDRHFQVEHLHEQWLLRQRR